MSDLEQSRLGRPVATSTGLLILLCLLGLIYNQGRLIIKISHLNDWHKAGCAECADEEGKG